MTGRLEDRLRRLAKGRTSRRAPRALLEAAFPLPPETRSAAPAVAFGLATASVAAAPFLPVVREEPVAEGAAIVLLEVAEALAEEAGR